MESVLISSVAGFSELLGLQVSKCIPFNGNDRGVFLAITLTFEMSLVFQPISL